MFDTSTITDEQVESFQADGAVVVRGLFADWIDAIRDGIEANMAEPGPYAAENTTDGEDGRFFDDYCNWQRIPQFSQVVHESSAGEAAARLMASNEAQVFHEHVLVKEPGTSKPTPWHQDSPYYFVEGHQTVSLWAPMDPVDEATLRVVAGSHRWSKPVLPTRWLKGTDFYPNSDDYLPVPDPDDDPDTYRVLEWPLEPGDVVAFDYRALHGARGNNTEKRRRAFSLRFVGDDARFVERPGPTSPPFPGHGMVAGDRLREDWFPSIYRSGAAPG